jgi:hypothetical protein
VFNRAWVDFMQFPPIISDRTMLLSSSAVVRQPSARRLTPFVMFQPTYCDSI